MLVFIFSGAHDRLRRGEVCHKVQGVRWIIVPPHNSTNAIKRKAEVQNGASFVKVL